MQKLNIVFLDIDGVLNVQGKTQIIPGTKIAGIEPGLIKRLGELCKETNAKVVLVSSWKYFYIHKYFSFSGRYLADNFKKHKIECVDIIPDTENTRGANTLASIEFINKSKCGYTLNKYIILDDTHWDEYEAEGLGQQLVKVNAEVGFSESDFNRALELLR